MRYDITPIVTVYDGIVFRSRLESYCYEYIKSYFPKCTDIYYEEPFLTEWTPDFTVRSNNCDYLFEVKPSPLFFDKDEYLKAFNYNIDGVILMDSQSMTIYKNRNECLTINHDEFYWKESFNTVKNKRQ